MSDKRTVLVAGAMGTQGGAAVEALLERGHKVIALSRNPDSPQARKLAERGVSIAGGDFSDTDSLVRAATGADTAYTMSTPFEVGTADEIKQGIALIEALKTAGVGHVVFGSVASANKATGIPHFDSKFEIEKHMALLGVPYSIVAPVYFMENLLTPWSLPGLKEGKFAAALPAKRPLQQVAVSNIGAFAAALIERRESVFGKRYDIAGDELTGEETTAILSKVAGREIRYEAFPPDALRAQSADLAMMFEWFDQVGYAVDIGALRTEFREVPWLTFEDWVSKQDWSVLS